jgi:hypothetical protein
MSMGGGKKGQTLVETAILTGLLLVLSTGAFRNLRAQWLKLKCHIEAFESAHATLFSQEEPAPVVLTWKCRHGTQVEIRMAPLS